ncbi:aspartyl protease family protein [Lysobacter yangpyeongensis]|uniref:Aspartyl protease family protein n=1 Tax=Lysobacter yangpyeongensis TaxID=346182 RepID=A0ABW0SI89_9GAMM
MPGFTFLSFHGGQRRMAGLGFGHLLCVRPMKRWKFLLTIVFLVPLTLHAGSQDLARTSKGHLVTRVRIAGFGEQWFVVDTGASESALYAHARLRMGLPAEPGSEIEMHGAGGSQKVRRYRLPSLSVAGMSADRLLVSGLPKGIQHGRDVTGVLGRDVFGRYLVEFDLSANRFGLYNPGELPSSRRGWNAVPIRLMPRVGLVMLDVMLDGARVTAVLDTGARKTFVNWRAAHAAGVSAQPRRDAAKTAGGATQHAVRYSLCTFDVIAIGSTRFRPSELAISDLPVFAPIGMDQAPAMIVGLDLLGDRRFVIDYPGRRLLIER